MCASFNVTAVLPRSPGGAILAWTALKKLARSIPETFFHLLGPGEFEFLFKHEAGLLSYITREPGIKSIPGILSFFLANYSEVKEGAVLFFEDDFPLALIARLAGAHRVAGPAGGFMAKLLPRTVERPAALPGRTMEDFCYDLVSLLSPAIEREEPELQYRADLPVNERLVVLHTSVERKTCRWPDEYWVTLARKLYAEMNLEIAFSFYRDDSGPERMRKILNESCEPFEIIEAGDTLEKLAALVSRAWFVVSSSPGVFVLAGALGKKVTGIFSPLMECSAMMWKIDSKRYFYLSPEDLMCKECYIEKCERKNCMERIAPEDAVRTIINMMLGRSL